MRALNPIRLRETMRESYMAMPMFEETKFAVTMVALEMAKDFRGVYAEAIISFADKPDNYTRRGLLVELSILDEFIADRQTDQSRAVINDLFSLITN